MALLHYNCTFTFIVAHMPLCVKTLRMRDNMALQLQLCVSANHDRERIIIVDKKYGDYNIIVYTAYTHSWN